MNDWHYAKDRVRHGPVSEEELRGLIERGELDDDDLLWREGMPEWQRVEHADAFAAARARLVTPVLFPVGVTKFVLLSLVTFNVYIIFWMYQQWKSLREREDNWPFARALFGVIWCIPLFRTMRDVMIERSYKPSYEPGSCGALFILGSFAWRLPGPWYWIGYLVIVPAALVVKNVERFHEQVAPRAPRNARLTGWNILGLVIGGIWLILAIIGSTLPE